MFFGSNKQNPAPAHRDDVGDFRRELSALVTKFRARRLHDKEIEYGLESALENVRMTLARLPRW
jgi:hypothetical protein